jgi:hypothetical protein
MVQYPVIATAHEIWAINPENKHMLKLARGATAILDMYVSNRGINHAAVTISQNTKLVQVGKLKVPKKFDYNYVTILDTISGNSIRTAYPQGQDIKPLEERMFDIEFSFFREGDALKFHINGEDYLLFDRINNDIEPEENLRYDGDKVYFENRRVGKFDSDILYFGVINPKEFQRLCKKKNKTLFNKLKSFA